MSKNSIQDFFTQTISKKPRNKIGVVEYLEKIGGMDAFFFDTNEEADSFGKQVRKNIEDSAKEVDVDISYKVVRLRLKRTED
jgi:hypothetical protein